MIMLKTKLAEGKIYIPKRKHSRDVNYYTVVLVETVDFAPIPTQQHNHRRSIGWIDYRHTQHSHIPLDRCRSGPSEIKWWKNMKSNYHNVSFFFQKVLGSVYFLIFVLAFYYLFANNCHVSYFKRLKKNKKWKERHKRAYENYMHKGDLIWRLFISTGY